MRCVSERRYVLDALQYFSRTAQWSAHTLQALVFQPNILGAMEPRLLGNIYAICHMPYAIYSFPFAFAVTSEELCELGKLAR